MPLSNSAGNIESGWQILCKNIEKMLTIPSPLNYTYNWADKWGVCR